MKFQTNKRRKENEKTNILESEINRLQNSQAKKDIERVNNMKKELQDIVDEGELTSARKYLAKNQLERERLTRCFCSMNRKMKSRAQFEELHLRGTNERGEEVVRDVKKQSSVEWEVRKYYWSLYRKEGTFFNKRDILENIGEVKTISEEENCRLEKKITMEEISNTLKNTKNNVAPGAGEFTGSFYKSCWEPFTKYLINSCQFL